MSEEQQYQGDRWTTQTNNILKALGWGQIGDSNFDISCTNKVAHKTGDKSRKNPHGIDSLFSYFDPYKGKNNELIVESKNRKWEGLTKSTIQDFVKQLSMTVECARTSIELRNLGCTDISTGLLMIWCNEPELFKSKDYKNYLKNLQIKLKRTPIILYIASNEEILRWCSLIEKVKEIRTDSINKKFEFFYPSDMYSGGIVSASRQNHINLAYLFSSYIFAKSIEIETFRNGNTSSFNITHIFFFAVPSLEELEFMYSCIQNYQLEDCDEIKIHFYGEQTEFRGSINQFVREKKKSLELQNSSTSIKVDYMNILLNVPENYNIVEES